MKRFLSMVLILSAAPAFAQQMQDPSMLQQYLRAESGGYAPPTQRQAPQPVPANPYDTAYQQPQPAPAVPAQDESHQLNKGVAGMNF